MKNNQNNNYNDFTQEQKDVIVMYAEEHQYTLPHNQEDYEQLFSNLMFDEGWHKVYQDAPAQQAVLKAELQAIPKVELQNSVVLKHEEHKTPYTSLSEKQQNALLTVAITALDADDLDADALIHNTQIFQEALDYLMTNPAYLDQKEIFIAAGDEPIAINALASKVTAAVKQSPQDMYKVFNLVPQDFKVNAIDPKGDGNCGFSVIAWNILTRMNENVKPEQVYDNAQLLRQNFCEWAKNQGKAFNKTAADKSKIQNWDDFKQDPATYQDKEHPQALWLRDEMLSDFRQFLESHFITDLKLLSVGWNNSAIDILLHVQGQSIESHYSKGFDGKVIEDGLEGFYNIQNFNFNNTILLKCDIGHYQGLMDTQTKRPVNAEQIKQLLPKLRMLFIEKSNHLDAQSENPVIDYIEKDLGLVNENGISTVQNIASLENIASLDDMLLSGQIDTGM